MIDGKRTALRTARGKRDRTILLSSRSAADDPSPSSADFWMSVSAHFPLLTPAQEIQLARRVECGDQAAREQLVNSNVRLVASVARRYIGRGMPIEDMMQEGLLGLLRAVDKYDYLRGYRFSTYATHWIRQAISRAVANQGRCIRLPAHVVDTLGRVGRLREALRGRLGRPPTNEELAYAAGLTERRLEEMLHAAQPTASLDAPVGEEGDVQLRDLIQTTEVGSPVDHAFRSAVRSELEQVLSMLSPKEQAVIRLRFGFDDDAPRTLEETGSSLRITRERARQIEMQALAKLRSARLGSHLPDMVA